MSDHAKPPSSEPVSEPASGTEHAGAPHSERAEQAGHAQAASKMQSVGNAARLLLGSVRSPDGLTRLAGLAFILCVLGSGVLLFGLFRGWGRGATGAEEVASHSQGAHGAHDSQPPQDAHDSDELQGEGEPGTSFSGFIDKTNQKLQWKETSLGLGVFTFDVKKPDTEIAAAGAGSRPSSLAMAQIEIYIQCDTKETCDFIQERAVQVKAEVARSLVGLERDELFTPEGKRRLKRTLLERLNGWLTEGKIDDLFFSKMMVK